MQQPATSSYTSAPLQPCLHARILQFNKLGTCHRNCSIKVLGPIFQLDVAVRVDDTQVAGVEDLAAAVSGAVP